MRETSRFEYEGAEFWERSVKETSLDLGPHDSLVHDPNPPSEFSGYLPVAQNQIIGGHLVDIYIKEGWTGNDGNGEKNSNNGNGTRQWRSVYLHVKG